MDISEYAKDLMRKDLDIWAEGNPRLRERLESSLEAMVSLADNPIKRAKYEKLMDDEWLESFLILHYHTLMNSGEISRIEITPDFLGRRRKVQSIVKSSVEAGEDINKDAAGYDLFLVDPHDIRNMCHRAMIMAMYFMDERHSVEKLLWGVSEGEKDE